LIEKPNNCNVFGRKKTKEPHQDVQKWLMLPMTIE
jgi:hypothetical protein